MVIIVNVEFATRVFASQVLLMRGRAALHFQYYAESEKILRRGEILAPWNWHFAFNLGAAGMARDQAVSRPLVERLRADTYKRN